MSDPEPIAEALPPTDPQPILLELPDNHPARLPRASHQSVVAALCHVDRMFRPHRHGGTWWLRLRIPEGPETLVAPDYYLLRRVLAMEELHSILEAEEADLEADLAEEDTEEEFPLHVWGRSFGPESYGTPH